MTGHILSALEQTGWRVSGSRGAARLRGLKPTTLEARMRKLGIARPNGGRRMESGSTAPTKPAANSSIR